MRIGRNSRSRKKNNTHHLKQGSPSGPRAPVAACKFCPDPGLYLLHFCSMGRYEVQAIGECSICECIKNLPRSALIPAAHFEMHFKKQGLMDGLRDR